MHAAFARVHSATPEFLGAATLAAVALLLAADAYPSPFLAKIHDLVGATALSLIAFAYLAHQTVRRPRPLEWLKAALLAIAFLLWAASRLCANGAWAIVFDDFAIALFVLDVYWVIVGWPQDRSEGAFAGADSDSDNR
jgi:hypothetical protein